MSNPLGISPIQGLIALALVVCAFIVFAHSFALDMRPRTRWLLRAYAALQVLMVACSVLQFLVYGVRP